MAIDGLRPERADTVRNRARILDAVDELARGGEEVTVVAVARRAGLTRATTYRHFPDREALLLGVLAERAASVLGPLVPELERLPLADAMRHLARTVTTQVAEHAHLVRVLGPELDGLVRRVVPDEPLAGDLARRRASGQGAGDLDDAWLAPAVRALCLAAARAVAHGEPADHVEAQLAESLLRLVA
ncbi:TetR/AcrR family transcriptional regulator [Nocardioides sp. CFH 31398]|uniref:TetR/AcrR family transcriptional regulator n=1 Tax=Nocardioides sp. CFH 31398 TaxID=2919579 RepID=UPI001F05EE94|nr:TetR/AcrR family transcriptional regulator [Nocardioides sp. CFH 31398]MCH1866712.1 TetR/AcrR family transcriptional regulator [Nocardioides sp. CFH 31398]